MALLVENKSIDCGKTALVSAEGDVAKSSRLYCFGGYDEAVQPVIKVAFYDSSNKAWWVSTTPSGRESCPGTVMGSKIYFSDGLRFEAFNTADNTWTEFKALPRHWQNVSMASLGFNVYMTGCLFSDTEGSNIFIVFDTIDKIWRTMKPMNVKRRWPKLIEVGGFLYAFGGNNSPLNGENTSVERYDPERNEWTIITHLRQPFDGGPATAHNGKLYLCDASGWLQEYSPSSNTWRTLKGPSFIDGMTLASFEGTLLAIGGQNRYRYDPNKSDTYSETPPGGWFQYIEDRFDSPCPSEDQEEKMISAFDFITEEWGQFHGIPDMGVKRQYHRSFVVNSN